MQTHHEDLKVIVDNTINYFEEVCGTPAECGIPYLMNQEKVLMDYSAIIGISGIRRGALLFTAPRPLIRELVEIITASDSPEEQDLQDMVGEVANTIAGNARPVLGSEFMISVPVIIRGELLGMQLAQPASIVPINWNAHQAFLIIGLE